jgi:Glutaminase
MPNPNAIVGLITRIDPPVGRSGVEMFRESPDGFLIHLEADRSARLVPGDRAAGQLEILADLQQMQHPAYIEFNPDTRVITRLLIPLVAQIVGIVPTTDGVVVELEISHARHTLRRSTPDFEELLRILREAQAKGGAWIVTETDDHEIIDVRPFPQARAPLRPQPRSYFRDLWYWIRHWFWFGCISQQKASQMFNLVSATSCNPLTVPVPCIPFLYPDDGCWGRAHEMCRLMIAAGVSPSKVWIYGSLNAKTKNNPNCQVFWGWHVAPTLCVRLSWFFLTEERVIDPSLFTQPVSRATWKSVQGDPNAQLVGTSAAIFRRTINGATTTDPTYTQTNIVLATYRLQLKNRSLSAVGPPPYAFCP